MLFVKSLKLLLLCIDYLRIKLTDRFVFLDEVGALVFDVGHYSFRAGYAGEDTPKAEIPSMVGITEDPSSIDIDNTNGNGIGDVKPTTGKKYTIDTVNINAPKTGSFLQSIINCVVRNSNLINACCI